MEDISIEVEKQFEDNSHQKYSNFSEFSEKFIYSLEKSLEKFLFKNTGREPAIITTIHQLEEN